jgi:hypothetical protein
MRGKGKGDNPAQVGMTLKVQEEETHILPGYRVVGTGLLPRVCLVLPLLSLIKGLVCSLLHPPPVFLGGE